MPALHYEDFQVGMTLETPSRVISDADVHAFAELTGDRNPLHLDDLYAAATTFGGRIAHGLLGLSIAAGLLNQTRLTAGTLIAFLGLSWDFRLAIRPGDSVHTRIKVLAKRATRNPERGLVKLSLELLNEAGEVAQSGQFKLLVRTRG